MVEPMHTRRADDRRDLKNAYVEYRREGTAISRLFRRSEARRAPVVNVSKGGVQFRTQEAMAEGARLTASLQFPGAHALAGIKLVVRWSRPEHRIGAVEFSHVVGARFTEYSPEAWQSLKEFLKTS